MEVDGILFRAKYRANEVAIGHASDAELAALALPVATEPRDYLDKWSLIAIRAPNGGSGADIHALGWRRALRNTWITSVIQAVDLNASLISTTSGNTYRLGRPSPKELDPGLREHLRYALKTWGFGDVQDSL